MNNKLKSTKILKYAKKLKSVNYLGGKCEKCGEDNIFKLTFHHKNPNEKEFEYGDYNDRRWSFLKEELDKCSLLCYNCHKELHYNRELDDKRRNDKLIYLSYGGSKCIKCDYNKSPAALTFHHRDPKIKEFMIGSLSERLNSILELSNKIKKEIDKCDILCANCHHFEHSDVDFYNENYDKIILKSKTYKEKQKEIDREEVYKMYDSGIKQVDIANHFRTGKGTISDIIKKGRILGRVFGS